MSIPPRFVQELRDRLTLSEIVNRRVKLTRAGHEFKGCCPFHQEKTPSFYVNDDKQFFHCFGCGAHGDAVGFIMRHDNLSFVEALENLAAQAGMEVPRQTPQDIEQAKQQKGLHALCEDVAKWFEARLHQPNNAEVLKYITDRGLGLEIIHAFRLGYAPADDQALRSHLLGLGYSEAQMLEAGVMRPSTRGGNAYAFFRDRVMFPVTDQRGRVVAFGGRVLPEHLRPPQQGQTNKPPKYINSSDTPLFHKGHMLYAQAQARLAANDHPIIVVEGYMDVIACHQAGFRGAVAPLGTALTEEQIMVLWKMIPHDVKEPVLCFDGDSAGYRAAVRAADRILPLLGPGKSAKFAFLPEGEDPDTYIQKNGSEAFSRLIHGARPLVEFLWTHNTAGKTFNTPESRAALSALLDDLAAKVPEGQIQYHYRQAFREKTRALFGSSWKGFSKGKEQVKGQSSVHVLVPPPSRNRLGDMIPEILVLTILNHPELYWEVQDRFHQIEASSPDLQRLYEGMLGILDGEGELALDREALLGHINQQGLADIARGLTTDRLYTHAGYARPDADPDAALAGWNSLWDQWEKLRLNEDIRAASAALRASVTPENEDRMLALQQMKREKDEGAV
jgi:DNA primase